jgi:hypothetical protein
MPLDSIQSHHLQSAPRQTSAILLLGRGAETLHRAYKWSLNLQATMTRLPPNLFICGKFTARSDHNEMLQRQLAHSTKPLRDAEHIAIGEGNAPAPQAVRRLAPALPSAPIPPLEWRQIRSSKCPGPPLPRMRTAKITLHKVYFQSNFLKCFCACDCTAGQSDTLRRSLHGTGPAPSSQGTDAGATSETSRL